MFKAPLPKKNRNMKAVYRKVLPLFNIFLYRKHFTSILFKVLKSQRDNGFYENRHR